jgi:methylthioribose-1-phosphate isomerase
VPADAPATKVAATGAASAADASDPGVGRRAFFRTFGRQAIQTVGQVAGIADVVTKGTTTAAASLAALGIAPPEASARRLANAVATREGQAGTARPADQDQGYRSPYRLTPDNLLLLDQRGLPDRVEDVTCKRASDVSFYLRVGAARGGPLMAQLAAYGMALSAREVAGRSPQGRRAEIMRVARSLVATRPASRMLRWATDRVTATWDALDESVSGEDAASAIRELAVELVSQVQLDCAAIARTATELLPRTEGRPLHVLLHGAPGTLTCGQVGTAITALGQLHTDGAPMKVWVTETRPDLEGSRLASWELKHLGIEHVVITDSAVAWLLGHERIDAVLMGAEWIAANGDSSNVIGSRAVAELAAIAGKQPVPVYLCAPAATIHPLTADGSAIPVELRPGRDLGTYLAAHKAGRATTINPAADVIPAARITGIVTEAGVLDPRDATALAAAAPALG